MATPAVSGSILLESGQPLYTSNYVVVESCALAQKRMGIDAVRELQSDFFPALEIRWIDQQLHLLAMTSLLAAARRKLSLVDCSSFALMRHSGTRVAFAFDKHFADEGFTAPAKPGKHAPF